MGRPTARSQQSGVYRCGVMRQQIPARMNWCRGNAPFVCLAPFFLAEASTPIGAGEVRPVSPWTVMIYGGVDSTAERYIMPHLSALKCASGDGQYGEVILLIDRIKGATADRQILGEDFSDTRLYRLNKGIWRRISGGEEWPEITLTSQYEANTGDPRTLQAFIQFTKREFPAQRYALIVFGHGEARSVCPDTSSPCMDSGESEDPLFTAEITEGLTDRESVDLLWVDVCSFGGIENAYQFRPRPEKFHADVLFTSAPLTAPAPMARVLRKCGILGKPQLFVRDAAAFGRAAVEAARERLDERERLKEQVEHESWAAYDLTKVESAKTAVDQLVAAIVETGARATMEETRGFGRPGMTMNYSYVGHPTRWTVSPYFDLFDLARRTAESPRLSESVHVAAQGVMATVDEVVISSVGGERYEGFQPGKNGLYIVFPGVVPTDSANPEWKEFRWYHPHDNRSHKKCFGLYDWCREGAVPGNRRVENWFELLDAWYDSSAEIGGVNNYEW